MRRALCDCKAANIAHSAIDDAHNATTVVTKDTMEWPVPFICCTFYTVISRKRLPAGGSTLVPFHTPTTQAKTVGIQMPAPLLGFS
jgi:hypothetical protein